MFKQTQKYILNKLKNERESFGFKNILIEFPKESLWFKNIFKRFPKESFWFKHIFNQIQSERESF